MVRAAGEDGGEERRAATKPPLRRAMARRRTSIAARMSTLMDPAQIKRSPLASAGIKLRAAQGFVHTGEARGARSHRGGAWRAFTPAQAWSTFPLVRHN